MVDQHKHILNKFEDKCGCEMESLPVGPGALLTVVFFRHASLAFVYNDIVVYIDPLREYADTSTLPRADLILVTHEHYDHLDPQAVAELSLPGTTVIGSVNAAAQLPGSVEMVPGDRREVKGIIVDAVPAYNISPQQLQYHPKERRDNGYVISFGDYTVYVAGDTEPVPEMSALGKINSAFLPVNQPYTMTVGQVAEAVDMIKPEIFFPYHTTDTDISQLRMAFDGNNNIQVKIHTMP